MFHDILFLILGLALIILGGNYVTDGAVSIARRFNMSSVLVGITIVAFGSSTPDLVVSVMATAEGKPQLAIGDVVGADIFDFLLVIGIVALIRPIPIDRNSLKINYPTAALAAFALFACADDRLVDGARFDSLDRSDGLVMLAMFAMFLAYSIIDSQKPALPPAKPAAPEKAAPPKKKCNMWIAALFVAGGLAALVIGGNWIVDAASGLARKAGMSEAMVGLTIVGIGSSLPDLSTSVMAAIKNQPGIAIGNVMGSCIMDVLFVLGTCAMINPLDCGKITFVDYGTLFFASLLVWWFAARRHHTIKRWQGAILVSLYVLYMAYVIISH